MVLNPRDGLGRTFVCRTFCDFVAQLLMTGSAPSLTDQRSSFAALASFIQLVKTRPDLKDQMKSARNQDEVIEIAAS